MREKHGQSCVCNACICTSANHEAAGPVAPRTALDEALSFLEDHEWNYDEEGHGFCTECKSFQFKGHKPDCRLAAFIAKWSKK